MRNILSLSTLLIMSVTLFMATLGNGIVTGEVLAAKEGPACKSFENRNNPIKSEGPLSGIFPYSEQCRTLTEFPTTCGYATESEDLAELVLRPGLASCAKQNQ